MRLAIAGTCLALAVIVIGMILWLDPTGTFVTPSASPPLGSAGQSDLAECVRMNVDARAIPLDARISQEQAFANLGGLAVNAGTPAVTLFRSVSLGSREDEPPSAQPATDAEGAPITERPSWVFILRGRLGRASGGAFAPTASAGAVAALSYFVSYLAVVDAKSGEVLRASSCAGLVDHPGQSTVDSTTIVALLQRNGFPAAARIGPIAPLAGATSADAVAVNGITLRIDSFPTEDAVWTGLAKDSMLPWQSHPAFTKFGTSLVTVPGSDNPHTAPVLTVLH